MTVVVIVLAGVLGLAVGSFLNVVIHRVPAGKSLVRPASACPECGHAIRWHDNMPIVSWLALRGRCRDCGASISARYPLVEAATATAFALVAWWTTVAVPVSTLPLGSLAFGLGLIAYLWWAGASVALTEIDLDVHRLPDRIVLPTFVVIVVLLTAAGGLTGDWWAVLRMLIGAGALFLFYLVIAVVSAGGMGMGDVKLAAVVGAATAWLGWDALVVGALAAFVLGGLLGIVLLAAGKAGRRSRVPFGPWMLAGAWIGIVLGPTVWRWYATALGLAEGV